MAPRIYQCQCCADVTPCNRCSEGSVQFVIDIEYQAGGGVIMPADIDGLGYGEISTTCDPDSCVTLVRITNGGTGYTSLPTVTFSGGTSPQAASFVAIASPISSVTITNGGSYTARPTVNISSTTAGVTRLEAAELYAEISGAVQTVSVTSQGSGYTEPPTVHFHRGGGGTGATATANISGGRVTSVTVTGGGSGYRYPPDVSFSGGGGSGAVATSAIRGPVDRVVVVNPGRYRRSTTANTWPTLSFSGFGGAAATINWSGEVIEVDVASNCVDRDFADNPTATFTGGGGEGAEAVAYSSAAETLVVDVADGTCSVQENNVVGFDASSSNDLFPLFRTVPVLAGGVDIVNDEQDYEVIYAFAKADVSLAARDGIFFQREAVWMEKQIFWDGVNGVWSVTSEQDRVLYIKQNAARVEPDVEFELADQPAAASQAAISATFEEAEDEWGRTYWKISDGTVVKAGDNLFPITTNEMRVARGNLFPGVFTLAGYTINWSYGVPTVAGVAMTGFLIQPELAVTFRPIAGNRYEIDTVAVVSGGRRESRPGLVLPATQTVPIVMGRGYIFSAPSLLATIADGEVVSVAIQFRGNFIPPASIASIDPPEEPLGFWGGVDFDTRTTTYSEPDLEARAGLMAYTSGGAGAEFAVTLEQDTDANGRDFWAVDEIEVVRGGSGYVQDQPVRLWTGADTVTALAAVARINLPERRAPTILGWSLPRGSEADFAFTIGAAGDGEWEIADVEILNGGFGYQNGDLIILRFGVDYEVLTAATGPLLYIQTDDDGTITGVEIARAGQFWEQPSDVESVTVVRGGRYFKKVVTEVEIPIDVDCTTGAWQEVEYPAPEEPPAYVDVGGVYSRSYVAAPGDPTSFVEATRRCPLPTVSLSLQ